MFDAFISGQDGSPDTFYSNVSDGKYVAKSALYCFEVICADFILVRCRAVPDQNIHCQLVRFIFPDIPVIRGVGSFA